MRALLILAALLVAAPLTPAAAVETIILERNDGDRSLVLRAGTVVEVRLPGTPEAGPRWINRSQGGMRLATADVRAVVEGGEVSRTEMTEVFYFEATAPGAAEIRLEFKAGWDAEPLETWRVPVTVE